MKKLLILTVAAMTGLFCSPVLADDRTLASFDGEDSLRWQTENDGVMGGRSQGDISTSKNGTLLFAGDISLENNGGFSSVRTRAQDLKLGEYDGLKIRVQGDGRSYKLSLRTSSSSSWIAYWADFETVKGKWTTVEIPFSEWAPTSFGRKLAGPRLVPSQINSVGFMLYDKKDGPFSLEVDSISAFKGESSTPVEPADSRTTILGTAEAAGSFKTLLAAAQAAGLVDALSGTGPLTVFAPTDAAFDALPKGTVEELLKPENLESLRAVLLHHVVNGDVGLPALLRGPELTTLAGQPLRVTSEAGALSLGGARITKAGLRCDNGVIHVVNSVILPEQRDLATIADSAGTFETLVAAAKAAGLLDSLSGTSDLTVFAPTDEAFDALPAGTIASLLKPENRESLERILTHHIVKGKVYADSAAAAGTATSLAGTELTFGYANGLQVNGTPIIGRDISARNGVIHVIGAVLMPPELETPSKASQEDAATRAIRVIESAIEAGVPLYNDGKLKACCTVYELAVTALLGLDGELFSKRATDRLKEALDSDETPSAKAWTLRRAMDRAYREVLRVP
ncbi:MAG: transforming growth factor-beta-induced protein [Planctomycetota bacterium]|jgi:transforming growth factor-beta-induced protein